MPLLPSGSRGRAGPLIGALLAASAAVLPAAAESGAVDGNDGAVPLPDGQYVTPQAIPGANRQLLNPHLAAYPGFVAGEAVRARLSPDGSTLAIVTAGQNSLDAPDGKTDAANSTQYVFLYDVSGGSRSAPVLRQAIQQPNAHVGLVWAPDGDAIYAAGGADDAVYVYARSDGAFALAGTIPLGHAAGIGLRVRPNASGLAVSPDGDTLVAVNNYNESISVIDTASRIVRYEHDLRPYLAGNEGLDGAPGGTYPLGVALTGRGVAYVGAFRDRQVVAIDVSGASAGKLVARIPLDGNPNGMTLDAAQRTLYVAQDNADEVAVIDLATNEVVRQIDARAPAGVLKGPRYTGAAPFAVTLSPDGSTLYSVNDGSNSIAVIPLAGPDANSVAGLIPTAYAPKDVTFSADGSQMFIISGKSDTGPNPRHLTGSTALLTRTAYPGGDAAAAAASSAANQFQFQLERSTLVSAPVPSGDSLAALTAQVVGNNFYRASLSAAEQAEVAKLRAQVKHVIYIVKENRTFDQILGDLTNGADADPTLAVFDRPITPNLHRLASSFVTLDNFMDAADGSMDGWSLATRGRVTTTEEIAQQVNYAFVSRGLSYESEGSNRNIPVGLPTAAARDAATGGLYSALSAGLPGGTANLLAGAADVSSADAPFGIQQGFIYDAVLQAGGTVRNYGFLVGNIGPVVSSGAPPDGTPIIDPFAAGVVEVAALDPNLLDKTDLYFRGFDQSYPDLWRYDEWKREFDGYVASGSLPSLETVRFSHDHMGGFATALAGVNTPEAEQADDDLAVGRLVEAVAHSPFAESTLIFVTEDDTQDGPDHVDSHRAPTYVVGPFVKKGAVVSTRYNQVSVLRTIEDVLGAPHINLNTACQRPMLEVFDTTEDPAWTYSSVASTVLRSTSLSLASGGADVRYADGPDVLPTHDATYWAEATRGLDFSGEDRVPFDLFNEVLRDGLTVRPMRRSSRATPP